MNYASRVPSERWNDIERKKVYLLKRFKMWLLIAAAGFLIAVGMYMCGILVVQVALFIPDESIARVMVVAIHTIVFPIADFIMLVSFCLPVVSVPYLIAYVYAKHQQRFS